MRHEAVVADKSQQGAIVAVIGDVVLAEQRVQPPEHLGPVTLEAPALEWDGERPIGALDEGIEQAAGRGGLQDAFDPFFEVGDGAFAAGGEGECALGNLPFRLGGRDVGRTREIDNLAERVQIVEFAFPVIPHHEDVHAILTTVGGFLFPSCLRDYAVDAPQGGNDGGALGIGHHTGLPFGVPVEGIRRDGNGQFAVPARQRLGAFKQPEVADVEQIECAVGDDVRHWVSPSVCAISRSLPGCPQRRPKAARLSLRRCPPRQWRLRPR